MSIKLKVDPWCENCQHFTPLVDSEVISYIDPITYVECSKVYTEVTCERRIICEEIVDYLSKVR